MGVVTTFLAVSTFWFMTGWMKTHWAWTILPGALFFKYIRSE
jgi:hypothetical protein